MKTKRDQEALVEAWKDVPAGTEVVVRKDSGDEVLTKTRSEPWLLGGHTAVIQLVGISGCYSLERLRKAMR